MTEFSTDFAQYVLHQTLIRIKLPPCHVNSLNRYHPVYRLAKAYGLIAETGAEVVFNVEKVSE